MFPNSIQFGPFNINGYGFFVALGFAVGLWTATRRASAGGLSSEKVLDLGPWLIIGAILGARMLYVATFWKEHFAGESPFKMLKVWEGGLVYYGGLVGACVACIIYSLAKGLPLWKVGDVMAPSVALGQAFGRVGCFVHGCCYGSVCNLPWAIRYPGGHETHPAGNAGMLVHPTQIYEAVGCVALYLALAWAFRRRAFDGQIFALFLIGYAVVRSSVEVFRGDYPANQLWLGGATPAHLVSALILATGIGLLLILRARKPAGAVPNRCAR